MFPRVSRFPISLDPLIAEARRRTRRRRLLAAAAVLLVGVGAIALALELRSPGSGQVGTIFYKQNGLSLRYPRTLTRVDMCWSGLHLSPIAIWTTAQPTPKCKPSGNSYQWPPATSRLSADGVSVELASEVPPGPMIGERRHKPDVNAEFGGKPAFVSKPVIGPSAAMGAMCPAGDTQESEGITVYPNGAWGFFLIDVVVCGPDLAAGRRVVDGMLASLRFGS